MRGCSAAALRSGYLGRRLVSGMDATRRQRALRALTLMLGGIVGGVALSLDPARALAHPAFLSMAIGMCAWTVIENMLLRQDEPKDYATKRQTRVMQLTVMLAVFAGVVDLFHLPALVPRTMGLTVAGLTVLAAGAGIRFVAIRTLDRHFSYELRVEKDHELVQRGIYGVLRHPSYLGIILICIGGALTLQSIPAAVLGGLAMCAVVVWRISTEEAILRRAFGSRYEDYAERSWRLLPYIY